MDNILLEITDQIEAHLRFQQKNGARYILPQADVEQLIITKRSERKKEISKDKPLVFFQKAKDPAKELRSFACDVKSCKRCEHLAATRSHVVFGEGNPHADLMLIGEAPGAEEDKLGRPFVGKAGQLLTKIIAAAGFSRSDVYIANIIKCRPPENRNPNTDEIDQCIGYLHRQIDIVSPKVICTLGSVATQSLLNITEPISRVRGTQLEFRGCVLIPTFHPSYLLRSPQMKREAWQDILLVKKVISKL
ncbi:MAG: uracil-DNA glycosylase [Candidatus Auribacterota bacterium]|jgi:DNA polymerase|nr:uracil-DNA glycosylase [Candidatus Auribacterota bacterium]